MEPTFSELLEKYLDLRDEERRTTDEANFTPRHYTEERKDKMMKLRIDMDRMIEQAASTCTCNCRTTY
jgi:hypothetical protein